jgi:hypothetical protein
LVCSAIWVITLTTLPISAEDSPSLDTMVLVDAATVTASPATRTASVELWAISLMELLISSEPAETAWAFWDTCSAALETAPTCAAACPALVVTC